MAELTDRKLYLGPRLRVLRRELGINQTQMAEELGISPSYLNHLERNQRPLTAQMLLRLANTYDIDVREFVAGAGDAAGKALGEIFADALVRDIGIPRNEMIEVAENYPGISEAIGRFYRAIVDFRRMPDMIEELGSVRVASSPIEWLRSFAEAQGNHFAGVDSAAEAIAAQLGDRPAQLQVDLAARLSANHNIRVMDVPERLLVDTLRHYDFHRRRLMLAERLPAEARLFALTYQLAAIELAGVLREAVERAAAPDEETARLLLTMLTNYAAAAIVMPYERVRKAAEDSRYDVDLLEARFGVSFEQLAHRLTSLNRPQARGVPFFMLKIDVAGTISKRFTGEDFPFARFGGACPRWDIHATFRRPGEILVQAIETPDERRFFTLCKAMPRARDRNARSQSAIGLGCELKHAERLLYADQMGKTPPTTVGPACHVCEREACPDRALPPVTRSLDISQHVRATSTYPFRRV